MFLFSDGLSFQEFPRAYLLVTQGTDSFGVFEGLRVWPSVPSLFSSPLVSGDDF